MTTTKQKPGIAFRTQSGEIFRVYPIISGKLYQSARLNILDDTTLKLIIGVLGIRVVFNMWHTIDPRIAGITKHVPIPDGLIKDDSEIRRIVLQVVNAIYSGRCVLVHCYGGRNRAGLISALVCVDYLGMTGAQATEYIKSVRPNSLVNNYFVDYLKRR
jgi:protein tyrosine/serine phosphatase